MTIDRSARSQLSTLARQLVAGLITNDEFQYQASMLAINPSDAVVETLFWQFDGLYGDLSTYKLRGRYRLSGEVRRRVAMCILFLQSDQTTLREDENLPLEGPLGLLDLPVGLLALSVAIVLLALLPWWGVVAGIALVCVWLWWVHGRQVRWQARMNAAIRADQYWPFPDERSYRRSFGAPIFLTGGDPTNAG